MTNSSMIQTNLNTQKEYSSLDNGERDLLITTWKSQEETTIQEIWKQNISREIIAMADEWVELRPNIPLEGGNWTHYFSCNDGTKLNYESNYSEAFWCESEGKWYSGEKYQSSWTAYRHEELLRHAALNMAIAFQLTDNKNYSDAVEFLLVQYADLYPNLEIRNKHNTSIGDVGRLTSQSGDEAVLMTELAWIYDMVKAEIDVGNQTIVEEQLLRKGIQTLQLEQNSINDPRLNRYSLHNSAKMMVGVAISDYEFIDEAINGSSGFLFQLANAVLDDGLWYEGSFAYHNYTLTYLSYVVEAGRSIGMDLYNYSVTDPTTFQERTIKDLFLAPLGMARPDGALPRVNDDIRGINLNSMIRHYELANMIWDDAIFDWALSKANEQGNRTGWPSLFWGQPISDIIESPSSLIYSNSGIGILRSNNSFLMIDYGPHGGWHGHRDKLAFELYSHGEERFIDAGVTVYSLPISSEWFRSTLGHSTIMVDGENQLEMEGELNYFQMFEEGGIISVQANDIVMGVNASRTMMMIDLESDGTIVLDMLSAVSNKSHNYSSVLHGIGDFTLESNASRVNTSQPQEPPWSYLNNCSEVDFDFDLEFTWSKNNSNTVDVIAIHTNDSDKVLIAEAPNNPPSSHHAMVAVNSTGHNVVFPSIIHSRGAASAHILDYIYHSENGNITLEVYLSNGNNISIRLNQNNFMHDFSITSPFVEVGMEQVDDTEQEMANMETSENESMDENNGLEQGMFSETHKGSVSTLEIIIIVTFTIAVVCFYKIRSRR